MAINIVFNGHIVEMGVISIPDSVQYMLESDVPTKCDKESIINAAESLLEL